MGIRWTEGRLVYHSDKKLSGKEEELNGEDEVKDTGG